MSGDHRPPDEDVENAAVQQAPRDAPRGRETEPATNLVPQGDEPDPRDAVGGDGWIPL